MVKPRAAAMNHVWFFLVLVAILAAAFGGAMEALLDASFAAAKSAVQLSIGLIGVMALWLGLMKVGERAGLLRILARAIRPIMVRLFPQVPGDHPAMSAMVMNMSANALGLGNAATPMGIKAMMELDRLNSVKGRATDAMCLFLAINTSNVTLLPLGVIGVRAAAGSSEPAAVIVPTLLATFCSTLAAIAAARFLARMHRDTDSAPQDLAMENGSPIPEDSNLLKDATNPNPEDLPELHPPGSVTRWVCLLLAAAFLAAMILRTVQADSLQEAAREILSYWLVPLIMGGLLMFGHLRGVAVYEAATEGAKEGFQVAVRIIPFLVMILVAVGMFRASGAFDLMVRLVGPLTSLIGMPPDALPMALMRPLSGSGAFGIMSETVHHAPDSFSAFLVSTMQGSTETTFYVLAVYFGAVGITRTRYALAAALLADATGILSALVFCRLFF